MKRGVTAGKVVAVASSLLLAGTYIAVEAGMIQLPFFSGRSSDKSLMSSSKFRPITAAMLQYSNGAAPNSPATQPATAPVFMSGSKYGLFNPSLYPNPSAEIPSHSRQEEDAAWTKAQKSDGGWDYHGGAATQPVTIVNGLEFGLFLRPGRPQTRPATQPVVSQP